MLHIQVSQSPSLIYTLLFECREEDLHKSMWKPDLGAIDGTIAHGLDEGEQLMVARVLDDLVEGDLFQLSLVLARAQCLDT